MVARRVVALVAASCLALGTVRPVVALEFSNEYAWARKRETAVIYDGVAGSASIRTDPATVNGVTYVHPIWVEVGPEGGDFVSIGTSNGAESSGPGGTCPAQMNPKWDLYVDWVIGGVYGCVTILANAYSAGSIQPFRVSWSFCDSAQAYRWVLYWSNVQRWCINHSAHAAQRMSVVLEVVATPPNTTDRNIDVKYNVLTFNLINQSTWYNWGTLPPSALHADPNYSATNPSTTTVNTYLAPLE